MKSVILTCLIVLASSAYAQCPTSESIVKGKNKTKDTYSVSSQSRAGAVKPGETYEMAFIAQAGMDYRLSAKAAEGGTITYEVYETYVEKKVVDGKDVFKRVKKVLSGSGAEAIEFTTDKTRKIYVSVTLTGGDAKKIECVGVLIEDKKTTKLGL